HLAGDVGTHVYQPSSHGGGRVIGIEVAHRLIRPLQVTGGGVQGIHLEQMRPHVHHAVGHGWRGENVPVCVVCPLESAGGGVKGVHVVVGRPHVHYPAPQGGGREDVVSCLVGPPQVTRGGVQGVYAVVEGP